MAVLPPSEAAFPFLKLPSELRLLIYEFDLCNRWTGPPNRYEDKHKAMIGCEYERQPPLTQICRQVRGEALPVYYGNITFVLPSWGNQCHGTWQSVYGSCSACYLRYHSNPHALSRLSWMRTEPQYRRLEFHKMPHIRLIKHLETSNRLEHYARGWITPRRANFHLSVTPSEILVEVGMASTATFRERTKQQLLSVAEDHLDNTKRENEVWNGTTLFGLALAYSALELDGMRVTDEQFDRVPDIDEDVRMAFSLKKEGAFGGHFESTEPNVPV